MIEHRNVEEITETKIGIITASDHSPVTLKIKLQGESFEKGTCQGTSSVSARWASGRMRSGLALRRTPIRGPKGAALVGARRSPCAHRRPCGYLVARHADALAGGRLFLTTPAPSRVAGSSSASPVSCVPANPENYLLLCVPNPWLTNTDTAVCLIPL